MITNCALTHGQTLTVVQKFTLVVDLCMLLFVFPLVTTACFDWYILICHDYLLQLYTNWSLLLTLTGIYIYIYIYIRIMTYNVC